MKYLFFDIECSVVSKNGAKICAFGYCLTDEQFHIIEKEDILINPQGGFHLTDRKGTQGLVLPYEYDNFKKCPTFPQVADKIYGLLQDSDTLVLGHATMNDVKYLNFESKRFSLPSFCFSFADTQFIYMNKIREFSRQFGLGAIAQELGVEFVAHRAVDDAYATMKIAEAMCKAEGEGVTLYDLLRMYDIKLGKIEKYEMTPPTSAAQIAYKREVERHKEERERKKAEFHIFADREKRRRAKEGRLKNKAVCFSHPLEQELPLSKKLLTAAFAEAAFFTSRAEECDIYVCFEGESGPRLKSVQNGKARIFTPAEFSAYLGV
ncbi:MAG: 3'-5' exonuclease [Clostridia bacterium]|nr:3'-5' exonuclease [Clostridia bacterium]